MQHFKSHHTILSLCQKDTYPYIRPVRAREILQALVEGGGGEGGGKENIIEEYFHSFFCSNMPVANRCPNVYLHILELEKSGQLPLF